MDGHWKRRIGEFIMTVTKGEIDGKCLSGRRTA